MKKFLLFVLLTAAATSIPGAPPASPAGTPVYVIVNGMEAGLRIIGGTQVQVWVYSTSDPTTQVLEYNVLVPINATNCCVLLPWNVPNTQTGLLWSLTYGTPIQYQIWQGACSTAATGTTIMSVTCVPSGLVQAGTIQ
jgi:hypothetical protein